MQKIKILLATQNPGKIREIKKILRPLSLRIVSLLDFKNKKIPKIVENGKTFQENALKKARLLADWSGLPTLADDSGLEIFSLGGEPGIKSARFAGAGASYQMLCEKVLRLLKNVTPPKRKARFVCVAALAWPAGRAITRTGYCSGYISEKMKGRHGFGYDPIFYYPPLGKNFGELPLRVKNKISHRSVAFKKIAKVIVQSLKVKFKKNLQ